MSDIKKDRETTKKININEELSRMLHGRPITTLKTQAGAGQNEAIYQLAHFYLHGYQDSRNGLTESVIVQDPKLAETYFTHASNNGHLKAKLHLARCYENGINYGKKDLLAALKLYNELYEKMPEISKDIERCVVKIELKASKEELSAYQLAVLLPPAEKDGSYEMRSLSNLAAKSMSVVLQRPAGKDILQPVEQAKIHPPLSRSVAPK